MKIAFLGMSHLGLVQSITAATKGLQVVCYDINLPLINRYEKGNFEIEEPHLIELYQRFSNNIEFTNNTKNLKKMIFFIFHKMLKQTKMAYQI